MTDKSDPLSNEVSFEAGVTETAVYGKVKSRFIAAADWLLGAAVQRVGVSLEQHNVIEKQITESKRAAIEALGEVLVQRIQSDPEYAERAIEHHFRGFVRKHVNKEAVVASALEELERLPPPDAEAVRPEQSKLDEDWLNYFEPLAEKASSEQLREQFGRILSDEVVRPGSFSISTLEILSRLNRATADSFQRLCSMAIGLEEKTYVIIAMPHYEHQNRMPNGVGPARGTVGEQLSEFGVDFEQLLNLRTMGLLATLPEELYPDFSRAFDGQPLWFADSTIKLDAKTYLARYKDEALRGQALLLTGAGHELRKILSLSPNDSYTAALRRVMATAQVSMDVS